MGSTSTSNDCMHGIWYRVTQRHLASPLSTRSARSLKLTCLQAWHSAKKWIDGNYAATTLTPNVSQRWLALSELLHQWRWWRGHSQWIIVNVIIVTANVGLMLILTSCYYCNSWNMRNGNGTKYRYRFSYFMSYSSTGYFSDVFYRWTSFIGHLNSNSTSVIFHLAAPMR